MSMFTVTDQGSVFALTDVAATKVAELIAREEATDLVLRVAVRPGGCSGLSYEMFFDAETTPDDAISEYGDVKVAIDPASLPHLAGATLDYKDGLQGAGFSIDNPNVNRTCGCGESFS